MGKIGAVVAKEIREAVPPLVFFAFLFHMIALTKAVTLGDDSLAVLRATTATVGALIVAKAILVVEALPIARIPSAARAAQILWKALLFTAVALLFRFIEEAIHLAVKHGGLSAGVKAMYEEISWPLFWVFMLWLLGGLLLYCLASELVRALGRERVRGMLFARAPSP